jgi:chromate transport protein ChrA
VVLATVLLASTLPSIVGTAPAVPSVNALLPAIALTAIVGLALAGYEYLRGDRERFATTRTRALLYAVFAFYVTATVTVSLVALRLGGEQVRSLPVVAWTVLSSGLVAVLVRRRVRSRAEDA